MILSIKLTQNLLQEFLLNAAVVRPVFIWDSPGIGKSSLVEQFAAEVGMECVSLLGSQLAPRGHHRRAPDCGRLLQILSAPHNLNERYEPL